MTAIPLHLDTDARQVLERRILAFALLLGVLWNTMLRDPGAGVAFPLWIAVFVLAMVAAAWSTGRDISHEAALWLTSAVVFSAALAWRDGEGLQFLNVVATIGSLAMAALASSDTRTALMAARFRDTVWAALSLLRTGIAGFLPIVYREATNAGRDGRVTSRARVVARSALIAGAVLLVFGSLLRSADPIFASLVSFPALDIETLVSHVVIIAFFAWVVSGWARSAFMPELNTLRAPQTLPLGLSMLDITVALGTLIILFAAFVVTQLGWFFGGETFLQERTGLTASAYARRGFFEMLWVVILVVPLLVATRTLMHPGRAAEQRHTALALAVIVLLGAIILSAAMRMKLYVHYYGLTNERLYPLVFMGWLAVVLVWLARTVLRSRGRTFMAGVAVSGLVVLVMLNVAGPDAFVARFNVERATRAGADVETGLDLGTLARLGGEAAPTAVRMTLQGARVSRGRATDLELSEDRCHAARTLLRQWGPESVAAERAQGASGWRYWNAGERGALRVVGANARELRGVARAECPRAPR